MACMVKKRNGQFVCSNKDRGLPVDGGIVGPATYNALMSAPRLTKACILTQNAAIKAAATKSAFTNNNATSVVLLVNPLLQKYYQQYYERNTK